jgi:hypothetical protein
VEDWAGALCFAAEAVGRLDEEQCGHVNEAGDRIQAAAVVRMEAFARACEDEPRIEAVLGCEHRPKALDCIIARYLDRKRLVARGDQQPHCAESD